MKQLYINDLLMHGGNAEVVLPCWLKSRRSSGGIYFLDVVDSTGTVQVVVERDNTPVDDFALVPRIALESAIEIRGDLVRHANKPREIAAPSGDYIAALALLQERLRELGGHTVEATVLPVRDLETGMTGEDVLLLQKLLNQSGYGLSLEGPGSPGNETNRFGALTRSALIKYQQANGITPAAGYFGPKTRAQMKAAGMDGVWW